MMVGYRGWKIRNISGDLILESPTHSDKSSDRYFWSPRENVAHCDLCGSEVPGKECACGIYALKSPGPELTRYLPDIIGQVLLYGKVIEGERGYRASHALISLFLLPSVEKLSEELLSELSSRYKAPLVLAKGAILKAITKARTDRLLKRGQLNYVAGLRQYAKDYEWMEKREYTPDALQQASQKYRVP